MSDQFVAEIRVFAGNFAPTGWALCNGQILPISQNTALFSLVGTFYGGDGKSTFALPNLQGNAAMHQGRGPGLSEHFLGEAGGQASVTLIESEMPVHTHNVQVRGAAGNSNLSSGRIPATGAWVQGSQFGVVQAYSANMPNTTMAPQTLAPAGSSLPHNNMMPSLGLTHMIALQGIFPPRG